MRLGPLLLALLLAACGPQPAPESAPEAPVAPATAPAVSAAAPEPEPVPAEVVADLVAEPVEQASAAAVAVAELLPVAPAAPVPLLTPAGEALIIRWEVSNRSRYERFLTGVICPGGASGPTWGIGYDGGHQTRGVIARDWQDHPDVERLVPSAGVTGVSRCKGFLASVVGVHTPYEAALHVFRQVSIPAYYRLARNAIGAAVFDALPRNTQAALVSLGYNRGWSLSNSDFRRHMRAIAYDCAPRGDVQCIAGQLRAMCSLWEGTPEGKGLCNRRNDEARLALLPD